MMVSMVWMEVLTVEIEVNGEDISEGGKGFSSASDGGGIA